MEKRYYIAYGSNLNVPQMRMRCPHASILGTATLKGWEFLFKGSKTGSYLTIEQSENGSVPVVIWDVTEKDEKALDRYEGFPTFYYKKEIKVRYKGIRTGRRRTRLQPLPRMRLPRYPHGPPQDGDRVRIHHARGTSNRHSKQLLHENLP